MGTLQRVGQENGGKRVGLENWGWEVGVGKCDMGLGLLYMPNLEDIRRVGMLVMGLIDYFGETLLRVSGFGKWNGNKGKSSKERASHQHHHLLLLRISLVRKSFDFKKTPIL